MTFAYKVLTNPIISGILNERVSVFVRRSDNAIRSQTLHALPPPLRGRPDSLPGTLRRGKRHPCGKGNAPPVGGTLHQREKWLRCGVFHRMPAALPVLSECRHFCQALRQAAFPAELSDVFLSLQAQGAHNIDLVTAGQYLPWVIPALTQAKPHLHIPIVYNSGGYELLSQLSALEGSVEIYLPDVKYLSPETAAQYAAAPDYPEIAFAALREMLRQTGEPVLRDGLMQRGCIVRHLVLPGHRHESISLLRRLAAEFGTDAFLLSLMAQYTPMQEDALYPELNRRLTKMEYHSVLKEAQALGFSGFSQELSSARTAYTPDFSLQGL